MDQTNPMPPSPQPPKPEEQPDPSFQVMPQPGRYAESASPQPGSVPPPPLPQDSGPSFFQSKLFYITIGVVILLGLGAGAYFMLGSKKSTSTPAAPVTKLPKVWLNQYFGKETCDDTKICGDDADPDNDGLKNYDEFVDGTSPINADTDSDGLADGDEVNIYKTEPTLKYTDRRDIVATNNWTDSFQIKGGYDPLTPAAKFTEARTKQIADDTAKFSLHEPTKTSLTPAATTPVTP